jgi:hypothetical protein
LPAARCASCPHAELSATVMRIMRVFVQQCTSTRESHKNTEPPKTNT